MIIVEQWWSFAKIGGCVSVIYSSTKVCINIRVARGQDGEEIKSVGEVGYAAICARCEGDERDGTRPLRPPCCTV